MHILYNIVLSILWKLIWSCWKFSGACRRSRCSLNGTWSELWVDLLLIFLWHGIPTSVALLCFPCHAHSIPWSASPLFKRSLMFKISGDNPVRYATHLHPRNKHPLCAYNTHCLIHCLSEEDKHAAFHKRCLLYAIQRVARVIIPTPHTHPHTHTHTTPHTHACPPAHTLSSVIGVEANCSVLDAARCVLKTKRTKREHEKAVVRPCYRFI